jgi:hypothetical protein
MFNAYHAALLGARGVMHMLGVAIPQIESHQFLIDAFPHPESKPDQRLVAAGKWQYQVYELTHFGSTGFRQEEVWEAFCRVVRVSTVPCWSGRAYDELRSLSNTGITTPRNAFLYSPAHWPLGDLLDDASEEDFVRLVGTKLKASEQGFLLRLSFNVYVLLAALVADLATLSEPINIQMQASRISRDPAVDELSAFNLYARDANIVPGSLGDSLH